MKRIKIISIVAHVVFVLLAATTYAGDTPKIGKSEAKKLIQTHIGRHYVSVQTGRYNRCTSVDRFPAVKNFYQKLQEAGLIRVNIPNELNSSEFAGFSHQFAQISCGWGRHPLPVEVNLTEKGKHTSIPSGNDPSRVGLLAGKRTVNKIVSVTDNQTVLFSYVYEPNDLGKRIGDTTKKYRGKAKIVYDPFLETYHFKGFWWSPWEHEHWDDNPSWTYEQEGRTVFTAGIDTDRAKAPKSSPSNKRSVTTAPMPSSQKLSAKESPHSSQQTQRSVLPVYKRTFSAPYEETWASVLKVLKEYGDTIEVIEKSDGVIKTKPSRRDTNWLMKYWVEYHVRVTDQKSDTTPVELEAEIYYRRSNGELYKGRPKAKEKTMKKSADEFFSQLEQQLR